MRGSGDYPHDWPAIARRVKEEAGWKCVRCGHAHHLASRHVLTVHHLDGDKANCRWWNIPPLCQRCHLQIQGRVTMERPWIFEHSDWFKPYVAGFYAHKYLAEELSRPEVEARLPELLGLESHAIIGREPITLEANRA